MSKQSGFSSLLAAAASFLVIGMVAVGSSSSAQAASEEDLAAPNGSFVSTMAVPAEHGDIVYRVGNARPVAVVASEEDLAAPQGSFVSTMADPEIEGAEIRLASRAVPKVQGLGSVSLSEVVANGLE